MEDYREIARRRYEVHRQSQQQAHAADGPNQPFVPHVSSHHSAEPGASHGVMGGHSPVHSESRSVSLQPGAVHVHPAGFPPVLANHPSHVPATGGIVDSDAELARRIQADEDLARRLQAEDEELARHLQADEEEARMAQQQSQQQQGFERSRPQVAPPSAFAPFGIPVVRMQPIMSAAAPFQQPGNGPLSPPPPTASSFSFSSSSSSSSTSCGGRRVSSRTVTRTVIGSDGRPHTTTYQDDGSGELPPEFRSAGSTFASSTSSLSSSSHRRVPSPFSSPLPSSASSSSFSRSSASSSSSSSGIAPLVGLIGGAALGAFLGSQAADDDESSSAPVFGAALGALGGLAAASVFEDDDNYEHDDRDYDMDSSARFAHLDHDDDPGIHARYGGVHGLAPVPAAAAAGPFPPHMMAFPHGPVFLPGGGHPGIGMGMGLMRMGSGGRSGVDVDRMSYDQLLALSERMGAARPSGASSEHIDELPTFKFQKSSSSDKSAENQSCVICMSEFADQEELRMLPCIHAFHKECIDEWLTRNSKCPVCRVDIKENVR